MKIASIECKHQWRQLIRMWSGSTDAKASFYCIHCLKLTEHRSLDDMYHKQEKNK